MSTLNIANDKEKIVFGNDTIVIVKHIQGIVGGRVLDMSGFADKVIYAGHVIVKLSNGEYAPLGVNDGSYTALPEGAKYVGILEHSMSANKPSAAILTWGIVNESCLPYPITDKAKFASDCPHIDFVKDESN